MPLYTVVTQVGVLGTEAKAELAGELTASSFGARVACTGA